MTTWQLRLAEQCTDEEYARFLAALYQNNQPTEETEPNMRNCKRFQSEDGTFTIVEGYEKNTILLEINLEQIVLTKDEWELINTITSDYSHDWTWDGENNDQ